MGMDPNRHRRWAERFLYLMLVLVIVLSVVGAATGEESQAGRHAISRGVCCAG